ncbi:DUF882 domain-containing protein [Thiomicrorhabdus aquaedulcis]|uniref:DUF882 domain-containing protein n=1 Tax=Thiomicrorhabdus aquaedulcis TaxID=2211106 RepID=UPI0018D59401|nr:DUF882 domain-containing protein [Thiomicrorhabdus aquaedulcis]
MPDHHSMKRRAFLKLGMGSVAAIAGIAPAAVFAKSSHEEFRNLSFYNTHTGETLSTTYWEQGVYHKSAINEFNQLLRDHRTGESHPIDIKLFDLLHAIRAQTGRKDAFNVISGYRSAKTNAMLNGKSAASGVAKKSLHMQGKAIDINLPGFKLADLRTIAMHQQRGGVGFYPKSNFIHVDTGSVRHWQ